MYEIQLSTIIVWNIFKISAIISYYVQPSMHYQSLANDV